jgi:hypothetical protein
VTSRRKFLISSAATLAGMMSNHAYPASANDPPNIIMVRFGGGVRRRETIDNRHSFSPWLIKQLAPQGTLFTNMVIDDAPHIQTSHGQGTLHLLTGRYDELENRARGFFGEQFEPPSPTLFEYFRRHYKVPSHETLIINGENRTSEEFYTFSNHHQFGINYRSEVLSLFRFKTWLLRKQLAENQFDSEQQRTKAEVTLDEMLAIDARRSEADGQGPILDSFWERWRSHYGDTGLVHARGDRLLTELAKTAMQQLKPRFMLLNYQDPDYVHWGYAAHYTRAISIIDRSLQELVELAQQQAFYRDRTLFVVVPDCGRDANPLMKIPFQHHFNSRSSREIWALFVGPGISRNRIIDREIQQIDVAASVAAYLDLPAASIDGSVLPEIFT